MRYYETLYIANPNYEHDRLIQLMENVANELNGNKVSIINHYIWSKKRLAYLIQKYKYGTFIILHFEAEKFDFLKDLSCDIKQFCWKKNLINMTKKRKKYLRTKKGKRKRQMTQ